MLSLPGVASWGMYHGLVAKYLSLSLLKQSANYAVIMATFNFTMMTLLAAAVVIILSIGGSKFYDRYKDEGYFNVVVCLYFYALACLVVNFFCSILMLSDAAHIFLNISMIFCVNSMIHVLVLIFAFIRIHIRSASY